MGASRAAASDAESRPLDAYVRVSRVGARSGERFISPDLQEERIRAYARSRGFEIGIVHRELDRSGVDRTRPQFQQALARVGAGESGGIIVAKLDRFARSALDALTAVQQIEQQGGVFVSVEDGFDSSTPFGRAMMTILLALAELEVARIRDTWEVAQGKAIARGVHTASHVPTGYRRGDGGRLVPDERAAPVILEAFRRRSVGATYAEIARLLTERGIVSSRGGRVWNPRSVEGVMKNRVYTGEARCGRYRNPVAHPPIVPMRLWLAAQFGADARVGHPTAETLLAGLIRCAGCCRVMGASWMPLPGGAGRGKQLNGYRCRSRHRTQRCESPAWVLARDLEPIVVQRLLALLSSRRRRSHRCDLDDAERELATADANFVRLWTEYRMFATDDEHRAAAAACAETVEDKYRTLLQLIRRSGLDQLPAAGALRKAWPRMAVAERRRALGAAFDAVVVERGDQRDLPRRVHFLLAGEMPDYFPAHGRRTPVRPFARRLD